MTVVCSAAIATTVAPGLSFAADKALHGAGATFPYPVYAAWAAAYRRETGVEVRYEPVGSGVGVDLVERRLVDFGASDAPLPAAELHRIGAMQFPAVIAGVVPVVNIGGIASNELRLSGAVLAGIYLGRIAKWNASEIAELNPGLALPSSNITVVHRADASGTTFLWGRFLAASSPAWRHAVGEGTTLAWPTGVDDTGNEGVASSVQRTRMSIGYVEYTYAKQHGLTTVSVRNHDGAFVAASAESFAAASSAVPWDGAAESPQLAADAPGADSWPITGASFILIPTAPTSAGRSIEATRFFDWAFRHGAGIAAGLDYVPLPEPARVQVLRAWAATWPAAGRIASPPATVQKP